MSRSGYSDDWDDDQWASIRYRGAVASAIRGARGQQLLKDILAALDAMPVKELIAESLVEADGSYCTLGVLGAQRGIPLDKLDPEDPDSVANAFGVAPALVREIVFENDEHHYDERLVEHCGPYDHQSFPSYPLRIYEPVGNPNAERWRYMRNYIAGLIVTKE